MTKTGWQLQWLQSTARPISPPEVWRGVETQYISSSTALVDNQNEHELLEQMLEESSKPALPPMQEPGKHYLLVTPFRYTPGQASRFRPLGQRGVWYGARKLRTACAEVAYWRMQFIRDSAGLEDEKIISHHTFFAASIDGQGIDLMAQPWMACRQAWVSDDYSETHRLAVAAAKDGIEVIRYESARDPGHACLAVLTPDVLHEPSGGLDATRQTWSCTATHDRVMLLSDSDHAHRFEFVR